MRIIFDNKSLQGISYHEYLNFPGFDMSFIEDMTSDIYCYGVIFNKK